MANDIAEAAGRLLSCSWPPDSVGDSDVYSDLGEFATDASCVAQALTAIRRIIETVDLRAMAADGPVTPTLQEMTQEEISEIYRLSGGDVREE